MKILHRFPLLLFAFFLVIGIILAEIGLIYLPYLGGMALLIFIGLYFFNQKKPSLWNERLSNVALFLTAIGLGAWIFDQQKTDTTLLDPLKGQKAQWVGIIDGKVKQKIYGQSAVVQTIGYWKDSSFVPFKCKIKITVDTSVHTPIQNYDSVYFVAKTKEVTSIHPTYLKYLHRNHIYLSAHVYQLEKKGKTSSISAWAYQSQQYLGNKIQQLMPDSTTSALTIAMFLGEEQYIDEGTQSAFAQTGVSHILAISGQHFAILYKALNFILGYFLASAGGKRRKYFLMLGILMGYSLLCGAAASIVRAVLMYVLVILAKLLDKRHETLNLLGATAILQILFNPSIIFNLGFQLSYMAVLGIVTLYPIVEKQFSMSHGFGKQLLDWLGVTFCAQLFTTPIILLTFGAFPTYFLLANFCLALVAAIITYFGFALVIFCTVPYLNQILAYCCHYLAEAMIFIVNKIVTFPHAVISESDYTGIFIVLMQLFLGAGLLYLLKHLKKPSFEEIEEPALASWGLD